MNVTVKQYQKERDTQWNDETVSTCAHLIYIFTGLEGCFCLKQPPRGEGKPLQPAS
jgi:hypothetical protein